ncbi:MAG: thioredoxin-disulfide reductase [Clostridia bacterium]|nr:thioredoxin-disulfide reductase [Clostridia bacterium]
MEKVYDVLIIGGGPAGYTAALYSARAGLSTLTVEKMSPGGQMTLTGDIENYPGFDEGVDGYTLGMKMQAGAEKFGAETVYGEVTEVDLSEKIKRTKTTDGEYFSKTVIIATGAVARPLGLPDEEALTGRGVHYCAHCDGRFYRDKTVMVVGGGNSAAADALYLSRLCKKVYLVHRRDTLRAERVYHAPLMSAENVEFIWNSTAVGLISEKRVAGVRVRDLKTDTETEISVDGLFVSIGRKPETSLFKEQLALEGGYIVAGEDTKTSIPGVFAAGDVRTKTLRQIITAAADGAVAATEAERYITEEF